MLFEQILDMKYLLTCQNNPLSWHVGKVKSFKGMQALESQRDSSVGIKSTQKCIYSGLC